MVWRTLLNMNVKGRVQTCGPFGSEGGGHGRTLCILRSTSNRDDTSNVTINFCHNYLPHAPPGFAPKILSPTLGLLQPNFCPGGIFWGRSCERRAFVYKRFLPFLKFSFLSQELATDNTLGFNICCSEILYVFFFKIFKLQISCQKYWWKFSYFHETQVPV